ncbi:MAG: hypothetical protein IKF01_04275 [Bacilli bacterium]|nr:hypothetical protein [Bacilli bacterium]
MKIKYKGKKYKVNLKDFFIIKKEQFILLMKRIKRLVVRAFKCFEPLLVVAVLLILYLILIYLIGRLFNEYHSFKRVIWDSKELIFSTLIIVFAIDFSSKERQRKNKLKYQRWGFEILVEQSDGLLKEICKCMGINYTGSIVLSEDLNQKFKEIIKNSEVPEKIILYEKLHEIIKFSINRMKMEYVKIIKNIKKRKYEVMGNNDIWIYQKLLNFCKEFETKLNYKSSPDKLKTEMIDLSDHMYFSCLLIGRVWAWDYKSNKKIRKILLKNINDNDCECFEVTRWF